MTVYGAIDQQTHTIVIVDAASHGEAVRKLKELNVVSETNQWVYPVRIAQPVIEEERPTSVRPKPMTPAGKHFAAAAAICEGSRKDAKK